MNETIQTILNHRSIRSFEDKKLTGEQIEVIVKSAQAASTSSFIQAYTIIGITDREKKEKLAELAGHQRYVAENGHLFVFCSDLHRHKLAAEIEGLETEDILTSIESTEMFMVSCIDAALAAQNAVIAAESMGLGICYIGGIRNNLHEVTKLLKTPDRVIPLFGLCVGYPAKAAAQKQRLPFENIYHQEAYVQDDEALKEQLKQYNHDIAAYYKERTGGKRADRWTEQIASKVSHPTRMYMKQFLQSKGLPLD
ncbi:FMN reductase (NADPH) [Scopulibacillus daqui]|uniref:FMN reductase (NADPH) n=1 Tax=Scopulibacillus daqui TaxID=1469162 RepID=A0ABS2PVE3_9BACL|nr:oxygen-insensitive NADPH nitroreductase [Scopulibacillus daqui]MBM7643901.1 FMN reductase (NADPH) [Scopulibacillus daqui]